MRKHDYALMDPTTGAITVVTSLAGKKAGDSITVTVPVLNKEMIERDKLTNEQIDKYLDAHPELHKEEITVTLDSDVMPIN